MDGQLLGGPWGGLLDAPLIPLARDGFFAGGVTFRFERDARGRINAVVVGNDKVNGLRLSKQ
jgi:hypothetical protein